MTITTKKKLTKKDLVGRIEKRDLTIVSLYEMIDGLKGKIAQKNEALSKLNRDIDRISGECLGYKTSCESKDDQISTLAFRANKYQTMYIEALNGFMYYEQREKRS